MSDIVVVDYGMANLRSVQKAFERVGHSAIISSEPDRIGSAHKIVLPGVGAFRDAIARLRESGLAEPLLDHLRANKPFFGICLGMQLLFTTSHEDGSWPGLDFLAGEVSHLERTPGLKIPHMGWNSLEIRRSAPPLQGFPVGGSVYFVHSYCVVPNDTNLIAATASYPTPFPAAIWQDELFATQFHPEKSQGIGLEMLRRFAEW